MTKDPDLKNGMEKVFGDVIPGEHQDEKYMIKVLEKAARILEVFNRQENVFTLVEIARRVNLSKPVVFRILKTLAKLGFVRFYKANGTYQLGLRFLELGEIVYDSTTVRKAATPLLEELARNLKTTVLVGVILRDQFVYIFKREYESLLRIPAYLGEEHRPTDTFLGMTLLAFLGKEEQERLLKAYPPKKITRTTMVERKKVVMRLDEAKTNGYYVENGEFIEGVTGVGVPIIGRMGNLVATLGVCVHEVQAKAERIQQIIEEMKQTSKAISAELGLREP
jgi:IclR family KDG regulon transcriptional repressor